MKTCTHRGCACGAPTRIATVPNAITVTRTIACGALAAIALGTDVAWFLAAAVGAYWLGDVADGIVARTTHCETRFGGALDIVCDRACCAFVLAPLVAAHPAFALPVVLYLLAFVVADTLLSLSFLAWPIVGVNYLGSVDRRIWRFNYSQPAKLANSELFLPLLALGEVYAATGLAACALVVKTVSLRRMIRTLLARQPGCMSL